MRLSHLAWNFGGLAAPLGVAVITVPHLIDKLGHERFGLLALAWGLIGYAGALDLGIGRALTQMVARLRGERNYLPIPDALATAARITLFAGLAGGILIVLSALLGADRLVNAQSIPDAEIQISMLLLAVALPAQAMSATYRGVNEAFMNFKGVSLLRAGLGAINFAGPYWVSLFTTQLPWLTATLVISRLLALYIFRRLANACLEEGAMIQKRGSYSATIAQSLFSFGGWVTVSSVVGPILVQADRFVIASTLSLAAVTDYVLPYEVVVQSLILVGAISSVMFPGLTKLMQEQPSAWPAYFRKWLFRVGCVMALVCIALALLLPILLPLWIKNNLNPQSIVIGQILCVGVFANAIGSMFYALLHAQGRADITAKIHLLELPLYIALLILLLNQFGIVGAAWAWLGRVVFDVIAMGWYSRFHVLGLRKPIGDS